ncbi:apolipoprotein N-acyltransferase [Desulfogranum japonicum]|uniref:apolipoprotein N-acyltransferase n=1 Tax=Desulfogranum japonicum TaxID=231447 RepID=UPI0004200611|nr:apolipoprotein N-acyltransferase [Desulfogranum japonicum]
MLFYPSAELSLSRGIGCSVFSFILLFVAMPGLVGGWPLLFIALIPVLYVCLYSAPRNSFLAGMIGGFVYHLATMYWIVIVLGQYGGLPVWISVPALMLLALYMGLYPALFCLLLSRLTGRFWHRERSIAPLVWAAPVLWVGLDYLRSVLFSGFPWLDIGYGLYLHPQLIQAADLGGHHLITFSLVLANGFILAIIDRQRKAVRWNVSMERRLLLYACAFLVFVFGYSYLRYEVVGAQATRALQAKIGLVQGNIDQSLKWSAEAKKRTVEKYISLSEELLKNKDTELIVWPETAVPFYLQNDPLADHVGNFVQRNNVWLLTGTPMYNITGPRQAQYFNAAVLINPSAHVAGTYSKRHLVPFGEYVPLKQVLPFLQPLVVNAGDFTAGDSAAPLSMGSVKPGVLICYESIFPDIARQSVAEGANILVNITNDAWYGRSSAPYQSLAMSVFRSVETKRSLVRAANTGVSGFIDPVGNVWEETAIFTDSAISMYVPVWEKKTVFNRSGWAFGLACFCGMVSVLIFYRNRE